MPGWGNSVHCILLNKSSCFLGTGPEIASIAVAILSAPDADISLVILVGDTLVGNESAVIVIIIAVVTRKK